MAPSKESNALAELFKEFGANSSGADEVTKKRYLYDQVHRVAAEAPGVTYEDITAGGRPALWIQPAGASKDHVVLYMHGGGFCFGSPNGHRKLAAHLAKACNCVSLSIDYRLTPEHPFPAPLDDCVAAYKWLLEKGYKAENIVVAGDSCGGGLSATVPLAAVEKGLPNPGVAVSLSPWYDLLHGGDSFKTNQDVDVLGTPEDVEWIASRYVAGGTPRDHHLVSPLHAKDLSGLPPTWISCAGYDMLRDQGVLFAEKAKKQGVEVVLEVCDGQQHVFEFMAGKAPEADDSLRRIGEWVRKKIGS